MPKLVLTAQFVAGPLAPGDYMDTLLPNFGLRVRGTSRVWFVRVREHGRRIRKTLGPATIPGRAPAANAKALTLRDARQRATDLLTLHDKGGTLRPRIVPLETGVQSDDLAPETMTVRALGAAYLAFHQDKWSDSWAADSAWYVNQIVIPAWGDQRAQDVTRRQVRDLVEAYATRAPVAANRLHSVVRKMFRWALKRDYLDAVPMVLAVERPTDEGSGRDRVLTADEVRAFWAALDVAARNCPKVGRARAILDVWRLRLLTAQRERAIRSMEWAWVNLDDRVVEFPARAMKRRKQPPFVLPLGSLAAQVLRRRRAFASPLDRFVFGTRTGTNHAPGVTRDAPLELPDFQGKDVRRTATTLMAEHGVSEFDLSRVLNHARKVDEGVTAIYNKYRYLDEKRRALDTLDRAVTAVLHPSRRQTVLRFKRA